MQVVHVLKLFQGTQDNAFGNFHEFQGRLGLIPGATCVLVLGLLVDYVFLQLGRLGSGQILIVRLCPFTEIEDCILFRRLLLLLEDLMLRMDMGRDLLCRHPCLHTHMPILITKVHKVSRLLYLTFVGI